MKYEEIIEMYNKDAEMNRADVRDDMLIVPKLHAKYLRILRDERVALVKYDASLKDTKRIIREYYTTKNSSWTDDQIEVFEKYGLEIRNKDAMPMSTADDYWVPTNKAVVEATLRYANQKAKVDLVVEIIKELKGRTYMLNGFAKYDMFKGGE